VLASKERALLQAVRQEHSSLIDPGLVKQLSKLYELRPATGASRETSPESESEKSLRGVLLSLGVKQNCLEDAEKKTSLLLLYTSKQPGENVDVSLRQAVGEHERVIQKLSERGPIEKPILLLLHALVVRCLVVHKAAKKGVSDVGLSNIDAAEEKKLNEAATKAIQAVSSLSTDQVLAALISEARKLQSVRMQCTWHA
jgi:hypothetical protein